MKHELRIGVVDCVHVDDLAEVLAAAGLDKRPEGK